MKVKQDTINQNEQQLEQLEKEYLAGIGYKFDAKKHIHSLDNKPLIGTTTALGVIAKPLTWWASGMAMKKLGWTNPKDTAKGVRKDIADNFLQKIKGMNIDEYMETLDIAYRAHADNLKDTAQAGTDLHAELERYVKDHMNNTLGEYDAKIRPFITWSQENVEKFIWSEKSCYSRTMWTGGQSDAGAKLKTGQVIVIDFKSSKEVYFNQFIQCAGYAQMIEENGLFTDTGVSVGKINEPISGVCVVPFGAKLVEPKFHWDIDELKIAFNHAVNLYKILNRNNAI